MNAEEFYASFEPAFSPGASAAGLIRSRGRALKWTYQDGGAPALAVGFRLNRKNLASYPGEFMPDISWNGVRFGPRDSGDVSFYQYALPEETEEVSTLRKRIVSKFIAEAHREAELSDERSLTRLIADASQRKIVPNQAPWLPYWDAEDVAAWGRLFGASIGGWMSRFLASPETLEAWCWRVLWSK